MTIQRYHIGKRLSDMVTFNGIVFLAGQVAEDPDADITTQTKSVLSQIDKLLAEAGSDKTRILSATIYLADIANFQKMNAVWDQWVPQGATPARATVEAKLANPKYLVEIQIVAAQ